MDNTPLFPGMTKFEDLVLDNTKATSRQYVNIFEGIINLLELSLQIFTICAIRTYENRITKDSDEFIKKVKPITTLLRDKYIAPSLGTHIEIARLSYHLVDNNAPEELLLMKSRLGESLILGAIGNLLDDLEKIYRKIGREDLHPTKSGKAQVVNRELNNKPLLTGILNQFVSFRNDSAHLATLRSIIEDNEADLHLDISTWRDAFYRLKDFVHPLLSITYRIKTLDKIESSPNKKEIAVINNDYKNGFSSQSVTSIPLDDWYENQWDSRSEIVMNYNGNEFAVDIFPFLILDLPYLSFYKRTRASGYQYYSISENITFRRQSKKKFNHAIFKSYLQASQQVLFWTEAVPSYNDSQTIKANIPTQGKTGFVGRKKQIDRIKEEIIEIPNQNGIVFGPGGVGKTALIIELSKQLYQDTTVPALFSNIIWAMAKADYYNPLLDAIEDKPRQFSSLENVLHVILKFFEYEDVEEYNLDELKELVLDLLLDNTVLLVLDNFETITKVEAEHIIRFFEITVKKHLRANPNNFKLVLTSRELIPSGFHQIKLEGLEYRDSKQLMKNLFLPYAHKNELTEDQFKLIHAATLGIPIVIVHFFGQLFEFNNPFESIVSKLNNETSEVIKFSYAEIFVLFRKDEYYLKTLILIELLHEPISMRQIAEILELDRTEISKRIPLLLSYQCIERIHVGIEEKYIINEQIGLLAKTLIRDNLGVTEDIRGQIARNLTLDRRMDYSLEEFEIIEVFTGYVNDKRLIEAESFLKDQILKKPKSKLLRFHYAEFLKELKNELKQSLNLLESLNEEAKQEGKQDANILRALASCYTSMEFPNYDKANIYYLELLRISKDEKIKFHVGEFYVRWSTSLKSRREFDPIQDMERRVKYKELASEGVRLLEQVKSKDSNHKYWFLLSQAWFNKWDNKKAELFIDKAIKLASKDKESSLFYYKLKKQIENNMTVPKMGSQR